MINWLIIFTECFVIIYFSHLFSRSNKSKIAYNENSCEMPILSFNTVNKTPAATSKICFQVTTNYSLYVRFLRITVGAVVAFSYIIWTR